ncbi:uncharacterized protein LOC143228539 [Tachypleus tridentatus]|uniref:uncharacterized protein LOC143228539 n=1 Tax=Tachypleus tridentatus TaxID=6853 RepID=UPI003FD13C2D
MFAINLNQIKTKLLLLVGKLIRTKDISSELLDSEADTKLQKCLTTLDLTSLGVGSCVGTGMYLVSGMVAKNVAGPGVILSFLVAAVASLFSGVCYAEFGVRVPHTSGSAYMYSYVTVGEFIAFVIGWNMILEYLIGTAAGACAISACIDAMCGGAISDVISSYLGTVIGHTPDLLAAIITVLMTALLVAGVKKSLRFNNILNVLNLSVWAFVIGAGLFYVDTSNWTKHGGFLPYGWSGVLAGAATCFYAFIGFDIIATTGEEAKNPKQSIPRAVIISLVIVLTAYITSSVIITLMVPYDRLNPESALVAIFGQRGAPNSKFIVAVGALAGLIVSMFGSMFPMPRVVYAMAKDGLIFRSLSRVWPYTETPAVATVVLGGATAFVATFMSLDVLVEMMSIGTLMAYTLVSTCVLILRYQPHKTTLVELLPESIRSACPTPCKEVATPINVSRTTIHTKRTNRVDSSDSEDSPALNPSEKFPSQQKSEDLDLLVPNGNVENSSYGTVHQGASSTFRISGLFHKLYNKVMTRLFLTNGLFENRQQSALGNLNELKFKAPGVPLVPTVAVIVNIYLVLKLSVLSLIRFTVWMIVGFLVYFLYGIKNSSLDSLPEPALELKIPDRIRGKGMKVFQEPRERDLNNECSNNVLSLPIDGADSLVNMNYRPIIKENKNGSPKKNHSQGLDGLSQNTDKEVYAFCGFKGMMVPLLHLLFMDLHQIWHEAFQDFYGQVSVEKVVVKSDERSFPTKLTYVTGQKSEGMVSLTMQQCVLKVAFTMCFEDNFLKLSSKHFTVSSICRSLSRVWPYTETPAVATVVLGGATAFVATFMSLDVLVEMMSIGTLMAYTLVSTCVLILRYQPHKTTLVELLPESIRSACPTPCKEVATPINVSRTTIHTKRTNRVDSSDSEDSPALNPSEKFPSQQKSEDLDLLVPNGNVENSSYGTVHQGASSTFKISGLFHKLYNKVMTRLFPYEWTVRKPPTECSGQFVMKVVGLLYLLIIIFDLIIVCSMPALENNDTTALMSLLLCLFGIVVCLVVIGCQPQTKNELKFKAPGVPLVPTVAVIVNIYLVLKLSVLSLIRFTVWMIVGFLVYFLYGIKNSSLDSLPEPALELKIPDRIRGKGMKVFQEPRERDLNNECSNNVLSLPIDGADSLVNMNYRPIIKENKMEVLRKISGRLLNKRSYERFYLKCKTVFDLVRSYFLIVVP